MTIASRLRHVIRARGWLARHRALVLVLVGAFGLRLIVALTMNPGFGDSREYLSGAGRLLDGQPLPALNNALFVRGPGYSIFIAGIWSLLPGRTLVSIRLAQAVVSTVTCFIIYLLARRIRDDRRTAVVAACLGAVYPYFLFEVGMIGSECLFEFLVVLGSYLFANAIRCDRIIWRDMAGGVVVYAMGILVRPNLAPSEALLGLLLAWRYRKRLPTVLAMALLMVTGTLLVTVPWCVAVERAGLGWMFVSDGGGVIYYTGHCDFAVRIYCEHMTEREHSAIVGSSWALDPAFFVAQTLPRSEQARFFWRTAFRWDSQHPSEQLCLAAGKLWHFWRPWVAPYIYSWTRVAASLTSLPLLVLGLAGLWRLWAGAPGIALVVAANVIAGTLLAMVYCTEIRYRIPAIDPLLVPYAASVATGVVRRAMARWKGLNWSGP